MKKKELINNKLRTVLLCFVISILYFYLVFSISGGPLSIFQHKRIVDYVKITTLILADIIVLTFLIYSTIFLIKNRIKHKLFIKHFIIYFLLMLVFLLLLWPGIFKGDEFYILRTISELRFVGSQHYLTSLFYMLSLTFFPTPGTITFFQILIISIIIGYIFSGIEKKLKHKKLIYLLYIIFLLPPVIDNNMFTLRSSLISFLFLLMIYFLNEFSYKDKNKYLFYSGFLSVIIACWKSDLIYVPILLLFYIIIFYSKKIGIKRIVLCSILFGLFFKLISIPQHNPRNYILTTVMNPLSILIEKNIVLTKEDKVAIEKVISIKNLKESADYQNIGNYFVYVGDKKIDKKDKSNFLKTYFKLVVKNPIVFINARLLTYKATNYSTIKYRPNHTGAEYPAAQWTLDHIWYYKFSDKYQYTNGLLNSNQKKVIISYLLMRHPSNYQPNKLNNYFYNVTYISIISIVVMIAYFIRKRYKMSSLYLIVIFQFPIVFMTAPASFWMYYICLYINLHFLIAYNLLNLIDKKRINMK